MTHTDSVVRHELAEVCRRVRENAAGLIADEEAAYERQIARTASRIAADTHGCRLVLQCGPSSVGKTTTADKLCRSLAGRGVAAVVVSLDDFYRGVGKAPRLPDGSFDYESPLAIDLEQLHDCIAQLVKTGQTLLPRYDFPAGRPSDEKRPLRLSGDTAVIFEGIHAFSPLLTEELARDGIEPFRIFVNTRSRFTDGEDVLLCRREIRLSRRLLRDERTRASSFENTMTMWQQVLKGDELYIFPHSASAHVTIDTTMGYEPCVLAPLMIRRLPTLFGTPYEESARRLLWVYERFCTIDTAAVPKDSVLREFIG